MAESGTRPDFSGWGKATFTDLPDFCTWTRSRFILSTRVSHGPGHLGHLLGCSLEAPDVLLESRDRLVLVFALPLLALAAPIALHEIVGVVPPIRLDLPVLQRQDRSDRLVEERQVVGDHQHPPAICGEPLDQPGLGVEVEVVGGLVEQQDIGLGEQDPCQLDPPPLASRHGDHRLIELLMADPQGSRHSLRLGLGDESTFRLEFVMQATEAGDPTVPLLTGEVVEAPSGFLDTALHGTDVPGHEDALQCGRVRVLQFGERRLLREVADGAGAEHRPLGRRHLPGQGLHQRRLPRPVAPNQPDAIA